MVAENSASSGRCISCNDILFVCHAITGWCAHFCKAIGEPDHGRLCESLSGCIHMLLPARPEPPEPDKRERGRTSTVTIMGYTHDHTHARRDQCVLFRNGGYDIPETDWDSYVQRVREVVAEGEKGKSRGVDIQHAVVSVAPVVSSWLAGSKACLAPK